jgi:hypothetical protein
LLSVALAAELIAGVALLEQPGPRADVPVAGVQAMPSALPSSLVVDGRTVRLIGFGGQANTQLLNRIAGEIAGAVDAVVGFWGEDWQRDILIVATATDEQFVAQAGPGEQWNGVAAAAVADRVDLARRTALGQRIVFAPGATAMSETSLRLVLRHELFHYASRTDTAPDAPRWITEGVADYVARTDTPAPGPDALPVRLPTDADFDAADPQRSRAYDRAWWFARFVADAYGPPKLRQLYLRACGRGHPDPATAVSDTLGAGMPEVLDRWSHWLAR